MCCLRRCSQEWGTNNNLMLSNLLVNFLDFVGWINSIRLYNQGILMKFLCDIFRCFLSTQSKCFESFTMTFRTTREERILGFAYMTQSDSFSIGEFMISDTHRTMLTGRDVATMVTNHPSWISFFVDQNTNLFALFEIFCDTLERQLRKIWSNLFGHIDEENRFFACWCRVIKAFVIHKTTIK